MSDSTTGGSERLFDIDRVGPIGQVRAGMRVVDLAGEEIGTVERVQMGDPGAATRSVGEASAGEQLKTWIGSIFGAGFELPEAKARQLLRNGFMKVDGPGIFDADRFVRADRIGRVWNDTVQLTVHREQLPSAE